MHKIPPSLKDHVQGYEWSPVTIGESRATVHRLFASSRPVLFLKSQRRDPLFGLAGEAARLRWLQGRAPVPRVVDFVEDEAHDYLLMSALPGEDAATTGLAPDHLVPLLAEALRELHAVDIDDCPFRHTVGDLIARARAVMASGQVDEGNFDSENLGRRPEGIFAEMLARKPESEEWVFTHGDFCLPNVMMHDGRLSGFIDVGTAGIGDRYRDLALVGRSITRNLGDEWVGVFFEHYGLKAPDQDKLRYYRLLDEFF